MTFDTTADPAIVIGGAHGIGEATVLALAESREIGSLVVADVDETGATRLAKKVRDTTGKGAEAVFIDLAKPDTTESLAESYSHTRRVAIVGGVAQRSEWPVTENELKRVVGVNLIGAYLAAQAFAIRMAGRSGGAIVAVASATASWPRRGIPAYCASKAGLVLALRCLALEVLPQGVRINTVSPGPTDTGMASPGGQPLTPEERAAGSLSQYRIPVPTGRIASPSDVASAIEFLLSAASAHIAMQDLVVDGGGFLGQSA